jgi:hypothetical protein
MILARFCGGGERMGRFIEGADRSQITLFPESLEDWIDEDNPAIFSWRSLIWARLGSAVSSLRSLADPRITRQCC